jgi:hypothetical protein
MEFKYLFLLINLSFMVIVYQLNLDLPIIQFFPPNIYRNTKNGGFILGKDFSILSNPFVKFVSKPINLFTTNTWETNVSITFINDTAIQYFLVKDFPQNVTSISIWISFNRGFFYHEIGSNMIVKGTLILFTQ